MTALESGEALELARKATGADELTPALTWRVERLDRPGEAYWLVILGPEDAPSAACAIEASSGDAMSWARLGGVGPHLPVSAAKADRIADLGTTEISLVWQACQLSMSPLYPFWRVSNQSRTVYVDQQGRCLDRIVFGRA